MGEPGTGGRGLGMGFSVLDWYYDIRDLLGLFFVLCQCCVRNTWLFLFGLHYYGSGTCRPCMSHNHILLFTRPIVHTCPYSPKPKRKNKKYIQTCSAQPPNYRFFALVFTAVVLPFGFLPAREGPGAAAGTGPSMISTSSSEIVNFLFEAFRVDEAGLVAVLVVAI